MADRRPLRGTAFLAGVSLALSRLALLLAVVMATLWSYSVWGSAASPLLFLGWPALYAFIAAFVFRFVAWRALLLLHAWNQAVLHEEEEERGEAEA